MANLDKPTLKNIETGKLIEILKSPFTIGRGLTSDYVIKSSIVSRTHCTLEKIDGEWVLQDSSTNGTMVNDDLYKAEKSDILKNNDEICLGFHTYTYKFLITPENMVNPDLERVKTEESHAASRSGVSPSPGSPFDENGISDDVLNDLANGILVREEEKKEMPVEPKTINSHEQHERTHKITPESIECDMLQNNIDQLLPSTSVKSFGSANLGENSSGVYPYNMIADPIQLILQPSQPHANSISQSECHNNFNQQPNSSVFVVDPGHANSNMEISKPSSSQLTDQLGEQMNLPQHTHTNDGSDGNSGEGMSFDSSLIANQNPSSQITEIGLTNEEESGSSSNTITYSLPEELSSSFPSLQNDKSVGLISELDNIPSIDSAPKNATTVEGISKCTEPNSNTESSYVIDTCNVTDPVERFKFHFTQTLDDVVKKYSQDLDSLILTSAAHRVVESNPQCSIVTMTYTCPTNTLTPSTSFATHANLRDKHPMSTALISPANLNKKVKITITPVVPAYPSTSALLDTNAGCSTLNHTVTLQNLTNKYVTNTSVTSAISTTCVSNNIPLSSGINNFRNSSAEMTSNVTEQGAVNSGFPLTHDMQILDSKALADHVVVSSTSVTENCDHKVTKTSTTKYDSQQASTSKKSHAVEPSKPQNQGLDQNQYEEMENELMCAICSNLFIKAVTLGCSHSFCQYCIEEWKKKKTDCPICRNKITSAIRTLVLDNIIEKMLENASLEDKNQRKEAIEERQKIEEAEKAANNKKANNRGGNNRARRGNRRGNPRREAPPPPPPPPVINLVDSPSTTDTDDSENSDNSDDYEYDDEWYNGVPGVYYGGYGRCYNCGDRGHWANGCPYR